MRVLSQVEEEPEDADVDENEIQLGSEDADDEAGPTRGQREKKTKKDRNRWEGGMAGREHAWAQPSEMSSCRRPRAFPVSLFVLPTSRPALSSPCPCPARPSLIDREKRRLSLEKELEQRRLAKKQRRDLEQLSQIESQLKEQLELQESKRQRRQVRRLL